MVTMTCKIHCQDIWKFFLLSNIKRLLNKFIKEINGFYSNSISYGDTDSLFIGKQFWEVLDEANLLGKSLRQGANDYETAGIFTVRF